MGLGSAIKSTVVTKYKADTSDHKRELKKLRGEEKKRHQALIDDLEKQNSKLDRQIATWGKVAGAVGGIIVAYKALEAGFETYEKNTRLRAANINTNLQGLQKATRGLVDDTRLLEFSAQAMNGTWAISQEQTETVLKGILALRKNMGVDLPTAMERVQQAINEANIEPLKELGIVIKAENETMGAQQAIIQALSDEYNKLGGNVDLATDSVSRAKVDFANSTDEIKENLGKIAVALTPIVEKLAQIVGFIAEIPLFSGEQNTTISDAQRSGAAEIARRAGAVPLLPSLESLGMGPRRSPIARGGAEFPMSPDGGAGLLGFQMGMGQIAADAVKNAGKAGSGQALVVLPGGGVAVLPSGEFSSALGNPGGSAVGAIGGLGGGGAIPGGLSGFPGDGGAALESLARSNQSLLASMDMAGRKDILSQILGTPADIQAKAEAIGVLSGAFGGLQSASVAALDAWMTGSESASDAFKKVIGASLLTLKAEMQVQAVKHAAMAIGSFAIGDGFGGAKHAAASGLFLAGAALANKVGTSLGGGSAPGVPSVGGTPASIAGVGGGAAGQVQAMQSFLVFGSEFNDMSRRERAEQARKMFRLAGVGVEGDLVERR